MPFLFEMSLKKETFVLGIIPARGGSKRLPGKNVKLLCGKPLIHYAILAGQKSQRINDLIISTDCDEIKKIAEQCGGEVPFLRPAELAMDSSTSEDALRHAVKFVEEKNKKQVDIIVLLQATLPFTTHEMIDHAVDKLQESDWNTVITVSEAHKRAEWVGLLDEENGFHQIIPEKDYFELARKKEYVPSGNVYVFTRNVLFEQKKLIGEKTGALVVPPERAVDIDYLIDFLFAEYLLKNNHISQ